MIAINSLQKPMKDLLLEHQLKLNKEGQRMCRASLTRANKMLAQAQKLVQYWGEELTRFENQEKFIKNDLSVINGTEEIL